MAKNRILALCLVLPALSVFGEGSPLPAPDAPYLIPQTVYVGDRGQLVLPLGAAFSGMRGIAADEAETLPRTQDLSVLRLEIENRGGRSRLLVDFTAYAPGLLQLPPIKIASFTFTGLEVEIASILDAETGPGGASRVLSPPAPPLSAPGTMALIYAALFGIIGFILLSVAMGIWGFPFLRLYRAALKRRRLIRSMEKFLRQLRFNLKDTPEPAEDRAAVVLDRLDREFRLFLKAITGLPCDTMTPRELALLRLDFPSHGEEPEAAPYGGVFLEGLFSRSDLFRFSGGIAPKSAALAILDEVQGFVSAVAGART